MKRRRVGRIVDEFRRDDMLRTSYHNRLPAKWGSACGSVKSKRIQPGRSEVARPQSGQPAFEVRPGASAGGGRQGSTYDMLDGAPNMDTYMSLAAPFPNPDATEEFRVVTQNADAHYGFAPGAIVTIQTRSGSNNFHGGAYDFGRNQLANASDYFGHNVDSLHRNLFGMSLGGPVEIPHFFNGKDKLFFFGNFETSISAPQLTTTLPTFQPPRC